MSDAWPPLPRATARESSRPSAAANAVRFASLIVLGFLLWNLLPLFAARAFLRIPLLAAVFLALFFMPVQSVKAELASLAGLAVGFALLAAGPALDAPVLFGLLALTTVVSVVYALLSAIVSALVPRLLSRSAQALATGTPGELRAAADRAVRQARFALGARRFEALWAAARLRTSLGDLREAAEILVNLERNRRARENHAQRIASRMSLLLALQGELPASAAWATEAKRRDAPAGGDEDRVYLAAEAVVASRYGNAAGAAQRIEEAWPRLSKALVDEDRALGVLRAFLLVRAGRPVPEGLSPELARSAAWLGARWPEAAEFLAQLGGQPAGAGRPASAAS